MTSAFVVKTLKKSVTLDVFRNGVMSLCVLKNGNISRQTS